jgi:hypothetical protein
LLLVWLALWCPRSVEAQAPTAALEWHVPQAADCASRAEIETRVSRLTERRLGATASARIVAQLDQEDGPWRARVSVFDERGHSQGARSLGGRPGDCRSLDVAVALVIATWLEGLPQPSAEPAADGGGAARAELGLGAAFATGFALAPSARFGAQLSLEMPLPLRPTLDASAYAPRAELDANGRGARLWAWHLGAAVCPGVWRGSLELRMCGGAQFGAVHAVGVGLTPQLDKARLLTLLTLEPKLGLALSRGLALRVSAVAAWAPVRPRFTMDLGQGAPHRLGSAAFVLLLRIGIIGFPP